MKTLRRSKNSMIGGVCGGIANYFNFDPTIMRIVWALAAFGYGIGILLYVIIWIVIPEE